LLLISMAPASAGAATPGANGRIAVWSVTPQGDRGDPKPWLVSLVTVNPDGSNPQVLDLSGDWEAGLEYSPDGRRLAFADSDGVHIVSSEGTPVRVLDVPGVRFGLAWAPNGRRLVVSRDLPANQGGTSDLFTMHAVRGGLRLVTRYEGYDTQPAWSSRGRIAFDRELVAPDDSFAGTDVFTIGPMGGRLRRVTRDDRGRHGKTGLDWAPNGRAIVYERGTRAGTALFRIRADGTRRRRLTGSGEAPAWSPNGRRIAYLGPLGLYTMRADGTQQRLLLHYPAGAEGDDPPFFASPAWQPLP
jgi:TolB protein